MLNIHFFGPVSREPFEVYQFIINLIVSLSVAAIFIAVFLDFLQFQQRKTVVREKKSLVETGTMTLFFLIFYFLIRTHWGIIPINSVLLRYILSGGGGLLVVIGCIVNITGRISLGKNWANQIKIYEDHTLIQTGVYRIVRHPLYASLIWMFYGACFIQLSVSAFMATTLIFVPFMIYRSSQEEVLLLQQFPEYKDYRAQTGRFFPKIFKKEA
jgi:protein-S-isoprenylcysteine O-methyltransferase Ste14